MCNSRFLEEMPELEDMMVPGNSFETVLRASIEMGLHPDIEDEKKDWIALRLSRHKALQTFERQWKSGHWEQINRYRTHNGGTLIMGTGISEQKRVEEELRRTQSSLMEAISNVTVGVDIYDADDRLSITSTGWQRIGPQNPDLFVIGKTFENILRKTVERGRIPDAMEDPETWIQWRIARHKEKKGSVEYLLDGGSWVQLTEYGTDDSGTMVTRRDITQRKNAEEKIAASTLEKGVLL